MGSCISSDNIKGNRGCIEVECDPEITKLSQLQNDVGYINESYLDNYYNKTDAENKFQEKGNYALKEDIPSKVSQLENDSEFINKTISNLENYYLKSEIYNKGEINNLLKDGKYLKFKIGGVKPEVGDENTIYLILNGYQGDNIYDEWIYIGNKWELLSSKIDLSQYYTKEYIDSNFQTKGNYIEIETDPTVPAWAKTPNKPEYTSEEVGAIPTGSLSTINGQSLETGENIELQPKTTIDSELSSTSSNPVENKVIKWELDKKQPVGNYVKSAELKAVAITGDYTDLINKPIIPSKVGELENDKNFITEAPNDNKPYVRINNEWKDFSNATLDSMSYGVEWDTKVSDPHLLRVGNPIFHKSLPVQSQFKGCIAKGKAIQYYLNPNDWTKKEDGTPSNLDGTDGDVMIHIPKFYGKSFINGDKRQVRISLYDIDGTWCEIPEVLVSAYKVTVSDGKTRSVVNTSAEFRGGNGNRVEYDTYLDTDPFRTDLGKPRTNSSRATMRKFAEASGGELLSYELYKWIFYWCYVIEYANFNSQEVFDDTLTPEGYHRGGLGNSVTDINYTQWGKYNGHYSLVPMGYCNSKGNFTGTVSLTIPNTVVDDVTVEVKTFEVPRWRGFDIPFGDTYTILDGIVIKRDAENEPSRVYTTIDPKCFDESIDNKHLAGIQIAKDSYIKEFDLRSTGEIIPSEVDSSSYNKNKCDYNYSNPTSLVDRGLLAGGLAHSRASAGLAFFSSSYSVGTSYASAGFRTVYRL